MNDSQLNADARCKELQEIEDEIERVHAKIASMPRDEVEVALAHLDGLEAQATRLLQEINKLMK